LALAAQLFIDLDCRVDKAGVRLFRTAHEKEILPTRQAVVTSGVIEANAQEADDFGLALVLPFSCHSSPLLGNCDS
jgi:hypothetical protein